MTLKAKSFAWKLKLLSGKVSVFQDKASGLDDGPSFQISK